MHIDKPTLINPETNKPFQMWTSWEQKDLRDVCSIADKALIASISPKYCHGKVSQIVDIFDTRYDAFYHSNRGIWEYHIDLPFANADLVTSFIITGKDITKVQFYPNISLFYSHNVVVFTQHYINAGIRVTGLRFL
jgi:hypothetical protein